jgi:pimeloyl-ACP methyl ester carboxylesterase
MKLFVLGVTVMLSSNRVLSFSFRHFHYKRHSVPSLRTRHFSSTTPLQEQSTTPSALPVPTEETITCSDGVVLAYQHWRSPSNTNSTAIRQSVLCLHGWMDNGRSFHLVAPALASRLPNADIYTLDLPGHGRSSSKNKDAPPMVQADLAYYVAEAMEQITHDNQRITLIGHSLGAGISSLYTAAFPEQIQTLILLDGAGLLARKPQDTALHVRNHIQSRKAFNQKPDNSNRIFPSLEIAIKTRMRNARSMPGNQYLSETAARELVLRATRPTPCGGLQFQHDPRFAWSSLQYMTWPQVEGIFETLGQAKPEHRLKIQILLAEQGWPFPETHIATCREKLRPESFRILPGSHYFHADPETADAVVEAMVEFLQKAEEEEEET